MYGRSLSSLWLLSLLRLAQAADFYVSQSNTAAPDGTSAQVFSSLSLAQEAIREALANETGEAITVHIENGFYVLEEPLNFTAADSGSPEAPVRWIAEGAEVVVSGGLQITNWQQNGTSGIYTAQVPPGTESRNLYIDDKAANYARSTLQRRDFTFDNDTMRWTDVKYDWIMNLSRIDQAEIRGINSFTDRYAPIESVDSNRTLWMKQHAWRSTVMGYDTMIAPNADFGFYIQNVPELLDEGGEFYLDSNTGTVYYMPLEGEDMSTVASYLGVLEGLIYVQGSLEEPIHDLSFEGINFAHTTWLLPGQGYGYVDQQTGAYICENRTYEQFEETRPNWCQMPSAVRISMASNVTFSGGSYTQLGSGGIGIGNDATAYDHGPGLGAQNVTVQGGYFSQVMGNSLSIGGVRAEAHHPNNTRSINSGINVLENVFYNVSSLFSATVPIMITYIQDSVISNNEIYSVPYSGICHGYGWGSNDANGTAEYVRRGLYDYQPRYQTPTTSRDNLISKNLIHSYGLSHTDLGAVYTLAKSPGTVISENYCQDGDWFGLYTDEASNSYLAEANVWMTNGNYYAPNQGCLDCGVMTANNTLINNFGLFGSDHYKQPNHTGIFNNTFLENYVVTGLADTPEFAQRVAYRSGVAPEQRSGHTVHAPDLPSMHLALFFNSTTDGTTVTLNISNFDDAEVSPITIQTEGADLSEQDIPTTVPGNSYALATWQLALQANDSCTIDPLTMTVTSGSKTMAITGTPPGSALNSTLGFNTTSKSPGNATFGSPCSSSYAIRSGGRGLHPPFDDMSTLFQRSAFGSAGNMTVSVRHIDPITPNAYAGLILRNQLGLDSNGTNNFTGYAAVLVDAKGDVSFAYDSGYKRVLDKWVTLPGVSVELPVWLRLGVQGVTISGYWSRDGGKNWEMLGERGFVMQSHWAFSAGGMVAGSAGGWRMGTAVFEGFEVEGKEVIGPGGRGAGRDEL